ncbi:MAG: hypothetical protein ABIP41_08890 [Croceibacterium sp.]
MKRIHFAVSAGALALAGPALAQGQACDRACLRQAADAYVAALVAHDPSKAPLAAGVVTVENAKRLAAGQGLWQSLSGGPSEFHIYVPDPVSHQIGYMAVMQESGKPVQVGIRLKLDGRRIIEAEHMVVHQISPAGLANLSGTPMPLLQQPVAEGWRDSRGRLLSIAASYYDALDNNNGRLAPFADTCERRENGIQTARNPVRRPVATNTNPTADPSFALLGAMGCAAQLDTQLFTYITRIDDRRVGIADEETGLVFGMSHFRHAQTTKTFPIFGVPGAATRTVNNEPFDLPAIHIFKIFGGQIQEIEAMGFTTAYNSPTGWEQ